MLTDREIIKQYLEKEISKIISEYIPHKLIYTTSNSQEVTGVRPMTDKEIMELSSELNEDNIKRDWGKPQVMCVLDTLKTGRIFEGITDKRSKFSWESYINILDVRFARFTKNAFPEYVQSNGDIDDETAFEFDTYIDNALRDMDVSEIFRKIKETI